MSTENYERSINPEQSPLLREAYLKIHGEEPTGLQDWELARRIVEVLDDPNWIDTDSAKECIYTIVHGVSYPDEKTRANIVLTAEDKARRVFPELSQIDEVHMDQIEYVYRKWLSSKGNK